MSVLVTACERLCVLDRRRRHPGRPRRAEHRARRDRRRLRRPRRLRPRRQRAQLEHGADAAHREERREYAAGLELSEEDLEHTLVLTHPKRNGTAATESPPRLLRRLSTRFGPVLDDAKYPGAAAAVRGLRAQLHRARRRGLGERQDLPARHRPGAQGHPSAGCARSATRRRRRRTRWRSGSRRLPAERVQRAKETAQRGSERTEPHEKGTGQAVREGTGVRESRRSAGVVSRDARAGRQSRAGRDRSARRS
jgi:hypothetical protein